jgi:molybdopterin-synthase adenylyltransferase
MNSLIFTGDAFEHLRRDLLADAPLESAALLIAGVAKHGADTRLLIRDIIYPKSEAYARRDVAGLTLTPRFIADAMKRARREGWSLVLVHTHPGAARAHFSVIDDECESVLVPVFQSRVPGKAHATLVLTESDYSARIHFANGSERVGLIRSVGATLRDDSIHERDGRSTSIFDRNVLAFGEEGQRRLRELHVGIVGLGGTGSIVAQQLAYLGVGRFTLIDPDTVELTNLNRLVTAHPSDTGRTKVDVASGMIQQISDSASVEGIVGDITIQRDGARLLGCDVIFCCTDSHGSRAILNHLSYAYYIPVIDCGVVITARSGDVTDVTGRVQLLAPTLACLVCENLLDAEEVRRDLLSAEQRQRDPYIVGERIPNPAVISFNATVSSLAVNMFLGLVTGIPLGPRHQVYRALQGVVRSVTSTSTPDCIVCSRRGALGRGDAGPPPWRRM